MAGDHLIQHTLQLHPLPVCVTVCVSTPHAVISGDTNRGEEGRQNQEGREMHPSLAPPPFPAQRFGWTRRSSWVLSLSPGPFLPSSDTPAPPTPSTSRPSHTPLSPLPLRTACSGSSPQRPFQKGFGVSGSNFLLQAGLNTDVVIVYLSAFPIETVSFLGRPRQCPVLAWHKGGTQEMSKL